MEKRVDFVVSGEFGLLGGNVDAGVVGDGSVLFCYACPEDGAAGLVGEVGKADVVSPLPSSKFSASLAGPWAGSPWRTSRGTDNAAFFHGCAFDEGYGVSQVAGFFAWERLHLDK
jgi:hypothetical protein